MIAYYFPPALAAGTFRTFRFVKYLPENGWKPLILTLNSNNYNKKEVDFNLLRDIPIDAEIFRTPAILPYQKYTNLRMALNKRIKKSGSIGLSDEYGIKAGENNDTLVRKVKLFIDELLRTPDVDVGWIPFVTLKALRLIYSKQIDVIYTTGGPFGTLVTGLILKKITGKPWVVDFRDPFSQNQSITYNVFKGIRRYLEKAILRNADRVIAVTDWLKKSFLECHPEIPEDRIITITNGFDPGDFKDIKPVANSKFTIAYIGSMYGLHSPVPFLQGLSLLYKESPGLVEKIDVVFVGPGGDEYKDIAKDLKITDIVRFLGPLSHRDALRWMMSSDLLLVTLTGEKTMSLFIPCKVFEYLGAEKPILAITPDGALKDLLRREGYLNICHPDDIIGIKNAILEAYNNYQSSSTKVMSNRLDVKYSSKNLTAKFAQVLNELVAK